MAFKQTGPDKVSLAFQLRFSFFRSAAPFVSGFVAVVVCSIERQKRRQRDTTDAMQVLLITLQLSYITLKRRQPSSQSTRTIHPTRHQKFPCSSTRPLNCTTTRMYHQQRQQHQKVNQIGNPITNDRALFGTSMAIARTQIGKLNGTLSMCIPQIDICGHFSILLESNQLQTVKHLTVQ